MTSYRPADCGSWLDPVSSRRLSAELSQKLQRKLGNGRRFLFVTLTYRRGAYLDPRDCFEECKDRRHLRRFFQRLSDATCESYTGRWIAKMEFHSDGPGWFHFHVVVVTRRFIPKEIVEQCWRHGFVDVRRGSPTHLHYFSKYVAKPSEVPGWVLGLRPRSLKVVRVSPGFWEAEREAEVVRSRRMCIRRPEFVPIGQRLALKRCESLVRSSDGKFRRVNVPFVALASALSALGMGSRASDPGWCGTDASFETVLYVGRTLAAKPRACFDLIHTSNPPWPGWLMAEVERFWFDDPPPLGGVFAGLADERGFRAVEWRAAA